MEVKTRKTARNIKKFMKKNEEKGHHATVNKRNKTKKIVSRRCVQSSRQLASQRRAPQCCGARRFAPPVVVSAFAKRGTDIQTRNESRQFFFFFNKICLEHKKMLLTFTIFHYNPFQLPTDSSGLLRVFAVNRSL